MSEKTVEALLKIFTFDRKRDLEQYCKGLVISGRDFARLVMACKRYGKPFRHTISYRDIIPEHLGFSGADHDVLRKDVLRKNGVGPLGPAAAKAVGKLFQTFEERRYLVGHMFYTPDLSEWHFFCFDQRDLEEETRNHWTKGSHVHFINWLWPGLDAQFVWSRFANAAHRPGSSVHVRFLSGLNKGELALTDEDQTTATR